MTTMCDHRMCAAGEVSRLWTTATVITAVRTVGALVLAALALWESSEQLLLASLLVYWVGDSLDGQVARWTNTETRIGGLIDILSDRLGCATFVIIWAAWHPSMIVPVAVFLLQFVVIDQLASLAYLRWPLRSPNYFYRVDRLVWLLNWSRIAKGANSGALIVIMVVFQWWQVATALALVMLALKVWTVGRILRLEAPSAAQTLSGCLAPGDGPTDVTGPLASAVPESAGQP